MVQEGVLAENIADSLPNKKYFKIGEASTLLGVKPHVLRYWETEFPQIRPYKSKTGQRLYRRRDVEALIKIQKLLYEERFTIAGARQALRLHTWSSSAPVDAMEEATDDLEENLASEPVVAVAKAPVVEAVADEQPLVEIRADALAKEAIATEEMSAADVAVEVAPAVASIIETKVEEFAPEAKVEAAPVEVEEHQIIEAGSQEISVSESPVVNVSSNEPLSEPAIEIKAEETVSALEDAVVHASPVEPVASVVVPAIETIANDAVGTQVEEVLESEMITETAVVEMLLEIQAVAEPVSEIFESEIVSPKEKELDPDMSRLLSMPLLTVKKELEELLRLLS